MQRLDDWYSMRLASETRLSLSDIHKMIGCQVSLRTFSGWHAYGSKFSAIAGGGTLYILILIAGLNLRESLASMEGTIAMDLGNILRNPPEGMFPWLVRHMLLISDIDNLSILLQGLFRPSLRKGLHQRSIGCGPCSHFL